MKKLLTLLLALCMLLGLSATVYADSTLNQSTEYEKDKLKRFTFSCPIDMYIYDKNGEEVAFLTSEGYGQSEENLSDYFYGVGRRDGGWDYTAYIPYDCTAKIYGYNDSMLRVYVTEDNVIGKKNIEIFGDIPINSHSSGQFEIDQNGNVTLNIDNTEIKGIKGTDFETRYDRTGAKLKKIVILTLSIIIIETISIAILAYYLWKTQKKRSTQRRA